MLPPGLEAGSGVDKELGNSARRRHGVKHDASLSTPVPARKRGCVCSTQFSGVATLVDETDHLPSNKPKARVGEERHLVSPTTSRGDVDIDHE